MKILFLVYHGFSEVSGISKKIHYQVKGLRENGFEVHLCYYGFAENGHRCRYIDDNVIRDYGTGTWAGVRQRVDYSPIYDYCIRAGIQFVYARSFMNANPFLISFFRRLRKAGIKSVTEIPTYPYDQEFVTSSFERRLGLKVDLLDNGTSEDADTVIEAAGKDIEKEQDDKAIYAKFGQTAEMTAEDFADLDEDETEEALEEEGITITEADEDDATTDLGEEF